MVFMTKYWLKVEYFIWRFRSFIFLQNKQYERWFGMPYRNLTLTFMVTLFKVKLLSDVRALAVNVNEAMFDESFCMRSRYSKSFYRSGGGVRAWKSASPFHDIEKFLFLVPLLPLSRFVLLCLHECTLGWSSFIAVWTCRLLIIILFPAFSHSYDCFWSFAIIILFHELVKWKALPRVRLPRWAVQRLGTVKL